MSIVDVGANGIKLPVNGKSAGR